MPYVFYLFMGIVPSLIWLSFYLRKDHYPEPKKKVLEIFFLGAGFAFLAGGIEVLISLITKKLALPEETILFGILYHLLGIALVEESVKYLVFQAKVLGDSELDEPVDVMIYMIISALGFAALENTLLFFFEGLEITGTIVFSLFRFVGATLLHALCSGLLGFFIALAFCKDYKKRPLILVGLGIATFLHGLYNFSIMEIEGFWKFLIPVATLISLAAFVSAGFKKLKRLKSVCKINSEA